MFSKLRFSRKENLKKCTNEQKGNALNEQKDTRYIWGNVYFGIIIISCLSYTKPCLKFLLIYFAREIKDFYQSSFRNEVDLKGNNQRFPKYLG